MPKPTSKKELQESSQTNYKNLLVLVGSLSREDVNKEFIKGTLNRNVRDVLTHLHHWHLMLLKWHEDGTKGEKPKMPAEGYTWKTLPDLNRKIWNDYQDVAIDEAKKMLDNSYLKIQGIIDSHTDEELFEKKRYKWTGSTSLGVYLISNTSSHYDWAYKRIKKSLK